MLQLFTKDSDDKKRETLNVIIILSQGGIQVWESSFNRDQMKHTKLMLERLHNTHTKLLLYIVLVMSV